MKRQPYQSIAYLVKDMYHYSSAGGCTSWLMSSSNNYYYGSKNITSGFKSQQMKWHILSWIFPSKPSSHILIIVGQKGKRWIQVLVYVVWDVSYREVEEMDIWMSCDLCHVTCGVMWCCLICYDVIRERPIRMMLLICRSSDINKNNIKHVYRIRH